MTLKGFNLLHLTKLTSHQVDHVTCIECCKYYIAPETASCGHSLCHSCWRGRRTCPSCAAPFERRSLRCNLPLQNLTEHIHTLGDEFEKIFNIKLDEFELDITSNEVESEADPTKNVKDWLASSQNQFSAPVLSSEPFSQDTNNILELTSSKIQVHVNSKKSKSVEKVFHVPPPQDDWDKIEQLPDTISDNLINNKENLTVANKQIPITESIEYSTHNPRRSSRKREYNEAFSKSDTVADKNSSRNSSTETEKKSNKTKQNWNNVKKMRKEFSKLNKKNNNKLDVSIENCKNAQSNISNVIKDNDKTNAKDREDSQPHVYLIEDNTPDINSYVNVKEDFDKHPVDNKTTNNKCQIESYEKENLELPTKVGNNDKQIVSNKADLSENVECSIEKDVVVNKMPFIKKSVLCPDISQKNKHAINIQSNSISDNSNADDIEITIKIGNTLTNIVIKKKDNDVQLKVNTDREVQTSLGPNSLPIKNMESNSNKKNIEINIGNNCVTTIQTESNKQSNTEGPFGFNKSISTKKNTASADTATAQFEITESVEKELSNIMECTHSAPPIKQTKESSNVADNSNTPKCSRKPLKNQEESINYDEYLNDLDIFDNGSVKEQNVQVLSKYKQVPSEILPTYKNTKSQKHVNKNTGKDTEEEPRAKKNKTLSEDSIIGDVIAKKDLSLHPSNKDSESINYDAVMGQVFASIDADIEKSQKSSKSQQTNNNLSCKNLMKSQLTQNVMASQNIPLRSLSTQKNTKPKSNVNEKYSENIFSVTEREEEIVKGRGDCGSTQQHIENLLTPGMCQDLISTQDENVESNKQQCTPYENDDSDKSVVEETPQKNITFQKPKNANETNNLEKKATSGLSCFSKARSVSNSQVIKSVINVSDITLDPNKTDSEQTIVEAVSKKHTLETPLTINKFVDHIKHKSTPVARKSLNFDNENIDDADPESTLCPSMLVVKTTQEKEFMTKAFEQSTQSPVKKTSTTKNIKATDLNYCIAGSCLSAVEISNLKSLCRKYNWKYIDKYCSALTHLVVGVDEENRSQRSVKYMCALAASKWIVSYEWVDACISTNLVVAENLYEALDGTGEPGPSRSRLAKTKLFEGITFFCLAPFSVLDVDALKEMLEAAGGRVASDAKAVRATEKAPAFLLAEPEHTQEDKFMYLALELGIVPVNYEWVLNCLGSYTLSSVHELLLCPAALLPPATVHWPDVLIAKDN